MVALEDIEYRGMSVKASIHRIYKHIVNEVFLFNELPSSLDVDQEVKLYIIALYTQLLIKEAKRA